MAETKKKTFWGLFRSRSTLQGGKLTREQTRRASDGDISNSNHVTSTGAGTRRRNSDRPVVWTTENGRRRPRRAPPRNAKGKGRAERNGHGGGGGGPNGRGHVYFSDTSPLSEWPPSGVSSRENLPHDQAVDLIARGPPMYKGHKRLIPHRSDSYYALYTTTTGNHGEETDSADQHNAMVQLTTLRIMGTSGPPYPWDTLEQPSLAFGYGARPGTITLNHWTSLSSIVPPAIELRDPGVVPRKVDLVHIFGRLKELEKGLEEGDEDLMYRNLYKRFLRDPDKIFSPHKSMDRQITDLIMVLSGSEWIDFTVPKNQVVTRFIFDTSHSNHQKYVNFFHQLLLSIELELRINSKIHDERPKEKLMNQIPPKIQWGIALARRWREYVRVGEFGSTAEQVRLRFKLRKRQAKMLKRFAQMMKWPNLNDTLLALKESEEEGSLTDISSHTMAFFSGLVLPGATFPFLLMNSLIDMDPDEATDNLALLTHLHPQCGFQYRNSYTYWASTCIVGKVLAPTCLEVGGWVGPARPSTDLARSEIARIRTRKPQQRITLEDVTYMTERSDPLGPTAEVFPVKEYDLVTPDTDEIVDTVRIELLNLKSTLPNRPDQGPQWFDAAIQFAIDGVSWPLRLNHDVSFIHAWPCSQGPHPLFFDYLYTSVKVDSIVGIRNWGSPKALSEISINSTPVNGSKPTRSPSDDDDDDFNKERVLVIESFGVHDNEVMARAWCSHWGLSAVVADIGKTCMACAIREAYAATLTVVILVEDQQTEEE